jgi:hypothetical protein
VALRVQPPPGMRTLFDPPELAGSAQWRLISITTQKIHSASKMTVRATAERLGVHRTTLETWRNEGCPGLPPGPVNLRAVKAWADREGKRADGIASPMRAGLRRQLLEEQHRALKLGNDFKEGILIERADVAESIHRVAGEMNSIRLKSESEDPLTCAAAVGDIPALTKVISRIWDGIEASMATMANNYAPTKGQGA